MDTYIILAGGYWHQSRKVDMGGVQVDPDNGDATRTLDYIIKINGLPDSYLQPIEVVRKFRFYCDTCKRWIKEVEIEQKIGCIVAKEHRVKMEFRDVEMWETGVMDRYLLPKNKWITPCYRVFVNTSKGIEKWKDIWRYVTMTFPATQRPALPKCVGEGNQWTITEDAVPVITLPVTEAPKVEPVEKMSNWTPMQSFDRGAILGVETPGKSAETPVKEVEAPKQAEPPKEAEKPVSGAKALIPCPVCGDMVKGKVGMRMHMKKHPVTEVDSAHDRPPDTER